MSILQTLSVDMWFACFIRTGVLNPATRLQFNFREIHYIKFVYLDRVANLNVFFHSKNEAVLHVSDIGLFSNLYPIFRSIMNLVSYRRIDKLCKRLVSTAHREIYVSCVLYFF